MEGLACPSVTSIMYLLIKLKIRSIEIGLCYVVKKLDLIMKLKTIIMCSLVLGFLGCGGSGGKKAIEFGEKVIKSWKKVPLPERSKVNRMVLEKMNQCPVCDGYGVLCLVDQYGNPIYYNGYLQLTSCEKCDGSGKRIPY